MMGKSQINDSALGVLILLFFLFAIHLVKGVFSFSAPDIPSCGEKTFVQLSGNIQWPGVYVFCKPPGSKELLSRVGAIVSKPQKSPPANGMVYPCGSRVYLSGNEQKPVVYQGDISAFYKITLGIPISLNRENVEGLTAVPGIGPRIAGAIIRERARRGGFKRVDEILSIPGIGPKLYGKTSRYFVL